ncbi:MAG: C/D box methylation guide ribonucleoprotein complex aNOP56 subunit [Candidatus Bathyarchaeota archaeon]
MRELSIVESVMGILALDGNNNIVESVLFEKDAEKIVAKLLKIEASEMVYEIEQLIDRSRNKCKKFIVESDRLARNIRRTLKVNIKVEKPSEAGEYLRSNLVDVAIKVGFVESSEDAYNIMRNVSMLMAGIKVKEAVARRDQMAIQLINTIDELDRTANLLAGRLAEWYGLHFPEMSRIVDAHDTYAKLVKDLGLRENFTIESLKNMGVVGEKAERLLEASEISLGTPFSKKDLTSLQSLCELYLETSKLRHHYTDTLDGLMGEIAPNLRELAGSTLGARLISLSGGLEKLARFPASTVQILGAEKALFRALKTGARPPKHGIIFQHNLIHLAPRWQRGKIARALAGKMSIAARIDSFAGSNTGEKLKASLESRVKEIKEKYNRPPERPPVKPQQHRRGKKKGRRF